MSPYTPLRPPRHTPLPLRDQRYHVLEWGAAGDQVPLVLLHGWMDVAASYQFLIDALDAGFLKGRLIIAPDWRGFGRTGGPAVDHYVFADYLGDLDTLLRHYAPNIPVDLIGHSMGGNVAMMYAGVRPQRVRRLVNLEGFGLPQEPADQAPAHYAQWLDDLTALARGGKALRSYASAAEVASRLRRNNPRLPADKALWLAQEWAQARTDAAGVTRWYIRATAAHRVLSAQPYNAAEIATLHAAITAPVLMVEADSSEIWKRWQGRYAQREFHERLRVVPHLQTATIAQAGHMLHHDQPAALACLIEDFLRG